MVHFNFNGIGQVLEHYRAKRSLTLKEVADHLGITHPAYRAYEKGEAPITLEKFQRLCELLKIPAIEAITGSTDKDVFLPVAKELVEELQTRIALNTPQ
jgi:transcriptional regulator with XRE-family HTH domain